MYVLIVMFILVPATTGAPNRYGVAMQEFSAMESCAAAMEFVKSNDDRIIATCVKK